MDDEFGVRLHLLPDPPLWSWEIVDGRTQAVVKSSWNDEWTAYESPEAAARAAWALLTPGRRPGGRAEAAPGRQRKSA